MRKGVGKVPGADPELWGILFEDLPEELIGRGNTPGRAELALYTAFTLYAIHQQSRSLKDENAHQGELALAEQQEKWQHKIRSH